MNFDNPQLDLEKIEGATVAKMTIGVAIDFETKEFEVNVLLYELQLFVQLVYQCSELHNN